MFTGLIQDTGTVQLLDDDRLQILCRHTNSPILRDITVGDSIAVDGICLTVEKILPLGFIVSASPETLSRTTLQYSNGQCPINLEASLRVGSKLGGHFVTGHIDGIGYVESVTSTATAWMMSFTVPDRRVSRYIVPKGSVAVNGVSLTVADCNAEGSWFSVAVIPVTYAETNLQYLQPGYPANLEGDVLGKYVEKFLRLGDASPSLGDRATPWPNSAPGELTPAFLMEHGYL